jgi:imidazolonepropionase-like amidohydrolase
LEKIRHIRVGWLIDGSGGPRRKNMLLTIVDSKFTVIEPYEKDKAPDPDLIKDLPNCTIVPALVDCSVSLSRSPSVDMKLRLALEEAGLAEKAALAAQHISYCYSHGVLGLADSDDSLGLVERLQQETPEENIIDIRTSGQLCQSREDCADGKKAGKDFLKINYSGILENDEALDPRLTREDLSSVLQQRGRKKAVVVANGQQRVKEALEAGCDAIEQGYGMGEKNLRKMADMDVLWIPSALVAKNGLDGAAGGGEVMCRFSMRYVAPGKADPGAEAFWKKMLAEQLAQLQLARKLGVKTAIGTGAGSVGILHGESMVEEMKLFIKAGWPLEETIRSASDIGARFFTMENLGALAVGRKATFLVARGTVQQLPRKLIFLENIFINGEPTF